jgi:hypothetical protein
MRLILRLSLFDLGERGYPVLKHSTAVPDEEEPPARRIGFGCPINAIVITEE